MTPQQSLIFNLLSDRLKHCPTVELFMKDDRTRISELRKMGYVFNEGAGICKEPKHHHGSKVKLRQLIAEPFKNNFSKPLSQGAKDFLKEHGTKKLVPLNVLF